jgi:hypothetical protein
MTHLGKTLGNIEIRFNTWGLLAFKIKIDYMGQSFRIHELELTAQKMGWR